jgi:signal peptidase II
LGVIIFDQIIKLLVFKNMHLYEEIDVLGEWFKLHFILNEGIAFGLKSDWVYSKLILTSFRFVASGAGIFLLYKYARKGMPAGALWAGSLILAGAIGNLIDSLFYGIWLENMPYDAPFAFMFGQVIDMLYFPLFEFHWPEWLPFVGGDYFLFFSAIFNVADASIFIGVMILLIWQKRFFPEEGKTDTTQEPVASGRVTTQLSMEKPAATGIDDSSDSNQ